MNCNVIKDLIPLYIDECCSEDSAKTVKEHIDSCEECKEFYKSMRIPNMSDVQPVTTTPAVLNKVSSWKASVLQSLLLFVSFAIITFGVAFEAKTPNGLMNGWWALSAVVPATGFMLSLANWYFIRLYKSKRRFSNCSLIATFSITFCAYIGTSLHYGLNLLELLQKVNLGEIIEIIFSLYGNGIILTTIFCFLSKALSNKYADMLGKE